MIISTIFILHPLLFGWSNQGKRDERGIWRVCYRGEIFWLWWWNL